MSATPTSPSKSPAKPSQPCTKALVAAASVSHELDKFDIPRARIQLGGEYLINHVLAQLNTAEIKEVIVIVGQEGAEVIEAVNNVKDVLFPDLAIKFHDLGEGWTGGHALSILQAVDHFKDDGDNSFLLCPVDHIYHEDLIKKMAGPSMGLAKGAAVRLLIETDLEGMIGLPPSTVHIALRQLHSTDRIYQIGTNLQSYSAIDAGLLRCTPDIFNQLEQCRERLQYFTLIDVLSYYCFQGRLFSMKTDTRTWFSVETDSATAFTNAELDKRGKPVKLPDGRSIQLVGLPSKLQATPSGGNWSEFSVAQWKDTIYCASSFFSDLFNDTTRFIRHYLQQCGGPEKALLVEVGCGTGEALIPLYGDSKWVLGVDINPKFIEFCESNVPVSKREKVRHIVGDASQLCEQLNTEWPVWMEGTTKVVICVGNTIGIIPEPIRSATYEQMVQLAGKDGVCIVVFWNGNCFGDALQHFYNKNPQLCGPFEGKHIDLSSCTLQTPSGYTTHWTTPEEATELITSKGFNLLACEEVGRGVLVSFKACHPSRAGSPVPAPRG